MLPNLLPLWVPVGIVVSFAVLFSASGYSAGLRADSQEL